MRFGTTAIPPWARGILEKSTISQTLDRKRNHNSTTTNHKRRSSMLARRMKRRK